MKNLKEYQNVKKQYIKLNGINSDNVYSYFNNEAVLILLRKYYEVYTKFLFNKLMGSLRLEVSKEKAEKLIDLKGQGSWEFAGMVDMYDRGAATCELGHPLRYVYKAVNVKNGEILNFGSRCVGDFFDLDAKGVKALIKVKDDMFVELKDMVAIKELGLLEEHYKYDCKELGLIIQGAGIEGLNKLRNLNPLMPIVIDFVKLGVPLPNSLLVEVLKFNGVFKEKLTDRAFLEIDDRIEILKASKITAISKMFEFSEQDVYSNLTLGVKEKSDFYNFRNVYDLNLAISIWINRNDRLLKAQDYFKNMGISFPWVDIYKYMALNRIAGDNPKAYYGVEILMLFDKDISVESSFYVPKEYGYKGYKINEKALIDFDSMIDYMATREFFNVLREVQDGLEDIQKKEEAEKQRIEDMISYLREHLPDEKYSVIKGIDGVRDIICNKKIAYSNMTDKQQAYVENKYKSMILFDSRNEKKEVVDEEINNRYSLVEKSDILAKIQRLQTEVDDLPDFYAGILNTVMQYKTVTDKQIVQINNAFSKYILGEENTTVKKNVIVGQNKLGNKKYNLIERPDVKDKILALQRHPDYTNIPEGVKNILNNILKYNSASEEQIRSVENTYNRYFRGR